MGSEMCIRDRSRTVCLGARVPWEYALEIGEILFRRMVEVIKRYSHCVGCENVLVFRMAFRAMTPTTRGLSRTVVRTGRRPRLESVGPGLHGLDNVHLCEGDCRLAYMYARLYGACVLRHQLSLDAVLNSEYTPSAGTTAGGRQDSITGSAAELAALFARSCMSHS